MGRPRGQSGGDEIGVLKTATKQPAQAVVAGIARHIAADDLPVVLAALIGYRVMYSGARKTTPVGVDQYWPAGDFTAQATGDFG